MSDFIKDALRTKSDKYYASLASKYAFSDTLNALIDYGNELDNFKKLLFYKKLEGTESVQYSGNPNADCSMISLEQKIPVDILHAILGIVTEGTELLEALQKTVDNGEDLDLVNIKEELGDLFWYQALLANALDTTFEKEQNRVIEKLKARFPDKFTEENALVRNLDNERSILENE